MSKKAQGSAHELALEDPLAVLSPDLELNIMTVFPIFSSYIYQLCNDVSSVQFSTAAVLRDFEDDGVVYLELRTTPRGFAETVLTKERYVETVLSTIEQYEQQADTEMKTALILSIDRRNTPEQAQECVDLAVRYADRGVVGVDLCGDPMKGDIPPFRGAFARAREHGLKITLHFGEAASTSSDEDLFTLLSFQPDRLGHVIHVSDTVKREIVKRKLPLELCISCNVLAKMIEGSFADHHFRDWWKRSKEESHPVSLCTDDVGLVCSPVSNEFYTVATHHGLSEEELWDLSYQSIDAIFGSEEEKQRLRELMSTWKTKEMGV